MIQIKLFIRINIRSLIKNIVKFFEIFYLLHKKLLITKTFQTLIPFSIIFFYFIAKLNKKSQDYSLTIPRFD